MPAHTFSALPAARQRFVKLLQRVNFGRIEGLAILDGQPMLDGIRVIREVKFGADNGPHRESHNSDFALKAQVMELFQHFDQLRDGLIESLVVKHGLPFSMTLETSPVSFLTNR